MKKNQTYSEWREGLENPYSLLDEKDKKEQHKKNELRYGVLSVDDVEKLAQIHEKARNAFERTGNVESAKSALLFEYRLADLNVDSTMPLIRLFIAGKYNAASTLWSAGRKKMADGDLLIAYPKEAD